FFSSRRRHTRSKRDWSSDVCSSDLWKKYHQENQHYKPDRRSFQRELLLFLFTPRLLIRIQEPLPSPDLFFACCRFPLNTVQIFRSEERRVGNECRDRWSLCYATRRA